MQKTDKVYHLKEALPLLRLNTCFKIGGWEESRSLIDSIYPENLTFDGLSFRDETVNKVVDLIYRINKDMDQTKNKTKKNTFPLFRQVGMTGLINPDSADLHHKSALSG